jgi:hypothetical protein
MCLNARMNPIDANSQFSYWRTEGLQQKAQIVSRACLMSASEEKSLRRRLATVAVRVYTPKHSNIVAHMHSQKSNSPCGTSDKTRRTRAHMTKQRGSCTGVQDKVSLSHQGGQKSWHHHLHVYPAMYSVDSQSTTSWRPQQSV